MAEAQTVGQDPILSDIQNRLSQAESGLTEHVVQRSEQGRQQLESGMSEIQQLGTERASFAQQHPTEHLPSLDESKLRPDPQQSSMLMMGLMAMAMTVGRGKGQWMNTQAAMNGAMEGYIKGNKDKADAEYTKFKTEYQKAKDEYQGQMDRYQDILKDKDMTLSQKMTMVKMIASENEHPDAYELAAKGRISELEKQLDSRQKMLDRHSQEMEKYQEHIDNINLRRDMADQAHQDRMAALGEKKKEFQQKYDNGTLTDEDATAMADQYLAGDKSVLTGLGRNVQMLAKVRHSIYERARQQGIPPKEIAAATAEFEGFKAGERTIAQKGAAIEMASAEFLNMSDVAKQASQKVGRTKWVPVNKALNSFKTNSGDPDIIEFGAANNTLVNIYARAVNPIGTPHESDKEHARELLSTAFNPEQYERALNTLHREIQAAQASPGAVKREYRQQFSGEQPTTPAATTAPSGGGGSQDYSHLWGGQ